MEGKPQQEHHWLQQMLGDWTMEGECDMGDGQPPMKSTGTEHVRGLGELWVVCEGRGEMPGGGMADMLMHWVMTPTKRSLLVAGPAP